MGKIPNELRVTIARNIRDCRLKKFPGRGGGKRCAESFGVSPQQWSPWERGMRTPDELRLSQIAKFFGVTVEDLRRDNTQKHGDYEGQPYNIYNDYPHLAPPVLREPEAPPYGLPPLRRDDNLSSGSNVAELALLSARIMGMIGSTIKGVADGRYDIGNTTTILRSLGNLLNQKLQEAEGQTTGQPRE